MEDESNKTTETTDKKEEFSKKTGEVGKKILEYIDKGVALSQKGLKSAGKAIGNFGDKSVQRIELVQLKKKLTKEYCSLGKFIYDKFSTFEDAEIASSDSDINTFMEKISKIQDDIKMHEDMLSPESGDDANDSDGFDDSDLEEEVSEEETEAETETEPSDTVEE